MNLIQCTQCGQEIDGAANYCLNCGAEIVNYPQPAGFWIRVCAHIIDGVIFIPLVIFSFLNFFFIKNMILLIFLSVPGLIYKPFMESFYGATLGKMVCGIKVIDGNGLRLTLETAYLRFLPFLLSSLISIISSIILYSTPEFESVKTLEEIGQLQQIGPMDIVGYLASFFLMADCIVAAFTYRKQALHDMMAGSYCVYKEPQEQQEQQQSLSDTGAF